MRYCYDVKCIGIHSDTYTTMKAIVIRNLNKTIQSCFIRIEFLINFVQWNFLQGEKYFSEHFFNLEKVFLLANFNIERTGRAKDSHVCSKSI